MTRRPPSEARTRPLAGCSPIWGSPRGALADREDDEHGRGDHQGDVEPVDEGRLTCPVGLGGKPVKVVLRPPGGQQPDDRQMGQRGLMSPSAHRGVRREAAARGFVYWPGGGSHNSNRVPSGSTAQPNRPYPDSSTASITSTPSARSWVSIASRSATRKLTMNACSRRPK